MLIIDYRRAQDNILGGCLGSKSGSRFTGHPVDQFGQLGIDFLAEAAAGTGQMGVFRHHVPPFPCGDFTHRNHDRIHGREVPADQGLQVADHCGLDHCRINAFLRRGCMAAPSLDVNGELVGAAHPGTCVTANMAGIHIEPHMDGKAAVHTFQGALFNHGRSTGSHFFCRLEGQFHRAAQVFSHILENMGSRQHHGNMAVMATGMHYTSIFAGKRKSRIFRNRQGIDIAPEQDGLPGLFPFDGGQDTGLESARNPGYTDLIQLFLDDLAGIEFLFTEFRMLMKIPSHLNLIITVFLCNCFHIHLYRLLVFHTSEYASINQTIRTALQNIRRSIQK